MSRLSGDALLDAVAQRILVRYLRHAGATGVMAIDPASDQSRFTAVDLVYTLGGKTERVKVKPDTYFGTDPRKIADHDRPFYRNLGNAYAFETISHHVTREPGWIFSSMAEEIHYYFIALDESESDVAALMSEPDEVFFAELVVARDELHVMPMADVRRWFESNQDRFTPRPVRVGDHSGWFRIVPVQELQRAVPGIQVKTSIFATASVM